MTMVPEHLRITRITLTTKVRTEFEEPDHRYRVLISLHRSDRPKYWTFSCHNCKADVCEMVNSEVAAVNDLIDMDNVDIVGNGWRCPGKFCRRWYYFSLS